MRKIETKVITAFPPLKSITFERVREFRASPTKRICFSSAHSRALKRVNNKYYIGTFNVPFFESVGLIFYSQTGLDLFPNKNNFPGFYRLVFKELEFQKIQEWIQAQKDRVFIKDALSISIALSEYSSKPNINTRIGALVHKAKYDHKDEAIETLASEYVSTIKSLPYYSKASCICAVPPNPSKKEPDIPSTIASIVAKELRMENITSGFEYQSAKPQLKGISLDKKWPALVDAKLGFSGSSLAKKEIILIDDLYQSGSTMQFVAMKLQEVGAHHIYGLSMAKNLSDTDNK
jgi:hypothetical protein